MSILNTRERQVRPTHPGEMLREDFMPDYGLTTSTLAAALGVSHQTIHELLKEAMRTTFAVAAGIALVSSLGGFELSYVADLPTGPVYVMIAASIWLLSNVAMWVRGSP